MPAMPGLPYHISVESVRWREALPSLHLFDAFRLAIHPSKLLLAFVLVVLLYLGGIGLDAIWAATWDTRPFAMGTAIAARHFDQLIDSSLRFDLGLTGTPGPGRGGVLGALLGLTVATPSLLWRNNPGFLLLYLAYAFALVALFGGAISRLAAVHACRELRQSPTGALRFAGARYLWFLLAPLLPLVTAGLGAVVLMLAGLLFFNLPGLDILGGVLFGLLLLLGLVLSLALLGFAVGVHLLYPAISIDGSDAFDAISRAYNYVLGRLGRFVLYAVVSILYFALTYLVVMLVIHAALWVTDLFVGLGSFVEATHVGDRYDAVLEVAAGRGDEAGTAGVAGWLVGFWRTALLLMLPAYAVSFYYSASTWVYLLLRRSADQVYFDDLYQPGENASPPSPAVTTETEATPPPPSDDAAAPASP